jgi:NADH dehydrogenase FAD-containing subunit
MSSSEKTRTETTTTTTAVVIGGGYAGITAAVSLAARARRRADVRVVLVTPQQRFVERLRLHQTAAGQETADLRIPELLADTGVEFVEGWVTGIDADARTVRVDDERAIAYDTLVYALGSVADTDAVPGAAEHTHTLDTAHDAEAFAARVRALPAGATVVIGGAGLTGVESAAEIAEQHPDLKVVLLGRGEPGAMMGPKARAYLQRALDRLGIEVRAGVDVVKILPDGVATADGGHLPADVVLWTSGVRVSPLAAAAGLEVDALGRIVTDPALRSVSHPAVYAVGDAAAIRQGYGTIHGTCQSGIPTGAHAAACIWRELTGKAPKAFRFGYIHQPVSLGRHDAVIQFTRADDTPARWHLSGRMAVRYKETVSSSPWQSWGMIKRAPGVGATLWRRGGRLTK